MVYDLDMLKAFYASFEKKIGRVRAVAASADIG